MKFGLEILVERSLGANFGEKCVLAGAEEFFHRLRGGDDLLGINRVEKACLQRRENRNLELDGHRTLGRLLEQLDKDEFKLLLDQIDRLTDTAARMLADEKELN